MSSGKSTNAIQLAIVYIRNDNVKGLEKVLNVMPLDKLGDNSSNLLSGFLSACANYDRDRAVPVILKAWSVIYPPQEQIQLLSRLYMMNEINLPTLAFVTLIHKDFTYVELMDDLILADNSPEVVSACGKADSVFGPQSYETYKVVMNNAKEGENWRVEDYAVANMQLVAPFEPVPAWVQNFKGGDLVPETELYNIKTGTLQYNIPTDEEAVALMTAGLADSGVAIDDLEGAKAHLLSQLGQMGQDEKYQLLLPILENQYQQSLGAEANVELFRLFGPAFPLVDQDLTQGGKSNMYGGCRMFLCDVFDYDEEFEFMADWFTGACETCHNRIKKRHHAVRKPEHNGGWTGCYCKWKCVRDSIYQNDDEPDLLTHELINEFERQINETGIQDRV